MTAPSADERAQIEALRRGDEDAFMTLVEKYHASLVRVAGLFVHDQPTAEETAQETWLAVLRGLDRFEGRFDSQDVDFQHPDQSGKDPRPARWAKPAVLRARG